MKTRERLTLALLLLAVQFGTLSSSAEAVTSCKARASAKTGMIDVSADGVSGPLLWGDRSGSASMSFANAATCISGSSADKCEFGSPGSAEAITPPDLCTVYLKDSGAECAAFIKGCTPGLRFTDQAKAEDLKKLLAAVSFLDGVPTLVFTGVNIQIVSGSGATDGPINGTGNLIIGYDANSGGHTRTGSHNLIVGDEHEYTSYGGLVAGFTNSIEGPWASVSGGYQNTASGGGASVSGGRLNVAVIDYASVSGGIENVASGVYASVSGGRQNMATVDYASVSGGYQNTASAGWASVSGGVANNASAQYASVSGGENNIASGQSASVSGGRFNTAEGPGASASGGTNNTASGNYASVSGGYQNTASGGSASVSGGDFNTASGNDASVVGGGVNTASGDESVVSGGNWNTAAGDLSLVSGGSGNSAQATSSTAAGFSAEANSPFEWIVELGFFDTCEVSDGNTFRAAVNCY